jgi:hypothetical protein
VSGIHREEGGGGSRIRTGDIPDSIGTLSQKTVELGGGSRIRTGDILLAKQALSR